MVPSSVACSATPRNHRAGELRWVTRLAADVPNTPSGNLHWFLAVVDAAVICNRNMVQGLKFLLQITS